MKGMIVYSFALRDREPNPCNILLAQAARRIIDGQEESDTLVVVAQRTVALALRQLGVSIEHVVVKREGYEGSEGVTDQAAVVFRRHRVTEVIPVAQPFLQLTKCLELVRKNGFRTPSFFRLCRMIGWIGFDPWSKQPWCRGPIRFTVHAIRQVLFGYRPPAELSE